MSELLSNLLNNSLVQTSQNLTSTTQSQEVVALVRELMVGQVLSGEVTSVNENEIQLLLDDNTTLNAKLDSSLSFQVGQSVFFEVSSSNVEQGIALRPMFTNLAVEENAMKALDMANLPVKEETLQLVKSMIDQQMPINRQSVQDSYKQMMTFPEANPSTVVSLRHLGIPITNESIQQFQQYASHEHQIVTQIEQLVERIPQALLEMANGTSMSTDQTVSLGQQLGEQIQLTPSVLTDEVLKFLSIFTGEQEGTTSTPTILATEQQTGTTPQIDHAKLLEQLMNGTKSNELDDTILQLKSEGKTNQEILKQVVTFISDKGEIPKELRESKEFPTLLKEVLKEQWLVKPDALNRNTVEELYQRLSEQTKQVLDHLAEFGKQDASIAKDVSSLRQNVDFMNQVNQFATYVQLPLKMANQNAHAELYVFADRKKLQEKEDDFSALLHLDMDHLGPLSVYVQLQNQKVSTKFTLADEEALDLVESHMDLLTKQIEKLGYDVVTECSVSSEPKEPVDLLFEGVKVEGERLSSHYAFDIRA